MYTWVCIESTSDLPTKTGKFWWTRRDGLGVQKVTYTLIEADKFAKDEFYAHIFSAWTEVIQVPTPEPFHEGKSDCCVPECRICK